MRALRPFRPDARPALAVAALTLVGFAVRLRVAGEPVFADELSTYWIVSAHDLGGVLSTVYSNAEITPPLSFVLTWLTTRAGLAPELLRASALIAGTASIPLAYLVGLRTVGRRAALLAAALTTIAPFMIYYSAEARGYGLAIALVTVSTLAMLRALDGGGVRWWLLYGVATCTAVYTHYTTVFVLGAQLAWLLWAHRAAWRPALLANAGALVCFAPWIPGLLNDFRSPTTKILSLLSPFTPFAVRVALEHWSIGYPYSITPLRELPGVLGLILLALGLTAALVGLARSSVGARGGARAVRLDRRVVLVLALALAAPVGEALASTGSTHIFGTRNLAVSWPGFALALAALLAAAGPRLRVVAPALVLASFALGAVRMLEPRFERPDYRAAARFIERRASPGDVVIEGFILSPGPLTGLDAALERPLRVFRAGRPQERDHPFAVYDPVAPLSEVGRRAAAAAGGRRIFIVATQETVGVLARQVQGKWLAGYRRVESGAWPGFLRLGVGVYSRAPSRRG